MSSTSTTLTEKPAALRWSTQAPQQPQVGLLPDVHGRQAGSGEVPAAQATRHQRRVPSVQKAALHLTVTLPTMPASKCPGMQTGELELASLGELPDDFALARLDVSHVRVGVFHVGNFASSQRAQQSAPRRCQAPSREGPGPIIVATTELDGLTALDGHVSGCEPHAVGHVDLDRACDLLRVAFLAKVGGLHLGMVELRGLACSSSPWAMAADDAARARPVSKRVASSWEFVFSVAVSAGFADLRGFGCRSWAQRRAGSGMSAVYSLASVRRWVPGRDQGRCSRRA